MSFHLEETFLGNSRPLKILRSHTLHSHANLESSSVTPNFLSPCLPTNIHLKSSFPASVCSACLQLNVNGLIKHIRYKNSSSYPNESRKTLLVFRMYFTKKLFFLLLSYQRKYPLCSQSNFQFSVTNLVLPSQSQAFVTC